MKLLLVSCLAILLCGCSLARHRSDAPSHALHAASGGPAGSEGAIAIHGASHDHRSGDQSVPHADADTVQRQHGRPADGDDGGGAFERGVRDLRRLAAAETRTTLQIIESLDEMDDLDLAELRVPKRALRAATHGRVLGQYGGRALSEGGAGGLPVYSG